MRRLVFGGVFLLAIPTAATAQETITYTYDAKGRVIKTERSGGPSTGATATYEYDKADNRSNVTVVNSPSGGGGPDGGGGATAGQKIVVVLPLNGFTVLVINR